MRLHRFLINEKIGDSKQILVTDAELIHQWRNVFRFTVGTQLILFDNSGFEYLGLVDSLFKREARIRIIHQEDKNNVSPIEVCLFPALLKKDNFEWVIEKATELGVSQIVPIVSDRSEKKGLNMARAQKIIKEASEQSGRVKLTKLNEPIVLDDLLKSIEIGDESKVKLFSTDPKGKERLSDLVAKSKFGQEVGIFVGPEGGWSERELELFRLHKIPVYSLGSQILRAETAAVAVSALFLMAK